MNNRTAHYLFLLLLILNSVFPAGSFASIITQRATMESVYEELVVYDIDQDGKGEIIADIGARLGVFDFDSGTLSLKWKKEDIPHATAIGIGDADNDGSLEILATKQYEQIRAFSGGGMQKWSLDNRTYSRRIPIGDIDGDGRNEIIIAGSELTAGEYKNGKYEYKVVSNRIMGETFKMYITDLDKDGRKEIVGIGTTEIGGSATIVYVFEWDGTKFIEHSKDYNTITPKRYASQIEVGDADNDGYDEIVTSGWYSDKTKLFIDVFDYSGNAIVPKATSGEIVINGANNGAYMKPAHAVGDMDKDGKNEIVFMMYKTNGFNELQVYRYQSGTITKVYSGGEVADKWCIASDAAVADMNGDGQEDIIYGGGSNIQIMTYKEAQAPPQAVCGNSACESGETQSSCCVDCGCPVEKTCQIGTCVTTTSGAVCGNGACESGETQSNCCTDCGCSSGKTCSGNTCISAVVCGNGACESGETQGSCCTDCGCSSGYVCSAGECKKKIVQPGEAVCGNGKCEANENCKVCSSDCGTCPPLDKCGDGICGQNEICLEYEEGCYHRSCFSASCAMGCVESVLQKGETDEGCTGGNACDGHGNCLVDSGYYCTSDGDCIYGYCKDGSCSSSKRSVCGNKNCEEGETRTCCMDCTCSSDAFCSASGACTEYGEMSNYLSISEDFGVMSLIDALSINYKGTGGTPLQALMFRVKITDNNGMIYVKEKNIALDANGGVEGILRFPADFNVPSSTGNVLVPNAIYKVEAFMTDKKSEARTPMYDTNIIYTPPVCGDGICAEGSETKESCPADCDVSLRRCECPNGLCDAEKRCHEFGAMEYTQDIVIESNLEYEFDRAAERIKGRYTAKGKTDGNLLEVIQVTTPSGAYDIQTENATIIKDSKITMDIGYPFDKMNKLKDGEYNIAVFFVDKVRMTKEGHYSRRNWYVKTKCGDGKCNEEEDCKTCAQDCTKESHQCCAPGVYYAVPGWEDASDFKTDKSERGVVPSSHIILPKENMISGSISGIWQERICCTGEISEGNCCTSYDCGAYEACREHKCKAFKELGIPVIGVYEKTKQSGDYTLKQVESKEEMKVITESIAGKGTGYTDVYKKIQGKTTTIDMSDYIKASLNVKGKSKVWESVLVREDEELTATLAIENIASAPIYVRAAIVLPEGFTIEESSNTITTYVREPEHANDPLIELLILPGAKFVEALNAIAAWSGGTGYAMNYYKNGGAVKLWPGQVILFNSKMTPKETGEFNLKGIVEYSKPDMFADKPAWSEFGEDDLKQFNRKEHVINIDVREKECGFFFC